MCPDGDVTLSHNSWVKPGFFRLYAPIDFEYVIFTEMELYLYFFFWDIFGACMNVVCDVKNYPLTQNIYYLNSFFLKKKVLARVYTRAYMLA